MSIDEDRRDRVLEAWQTTAGSGRGSPSDSPRRDCTDLLPEAPAAHPADSATIFPGGRYEVLEEVARGGMGVVFRVADISLDRQLAIKLLLPAARHHPEAEARFLLEAQIAGGLQHPNIPPVHEVGRLADGCPFFSMKLIQGQTLAEMLRQRPGPQAELSRFLPIFQQVCQAVAFAHAQGVIHRDLKPLNVMVGAFGEVQVMDWGLAKRLGRAGQPDRAEPLDVPTTDWVSPLSPSAVATPGGTGPAALATTEVSNAPGAFAGISPGGTPDALTRAGQVMGTPSYMPPEQASGDVGRLDERADVFALGAILCEVLTGLPPYSGTGLYELWRQAREADLAAAWERLAGCGADDELIELVRACLASERDHRPRHAGGLANRLEAYLSGVQQRLERARADRIAAEVRSSEERKRRRLTVVLMASLLFLVIGASGAGLWYQARQGVVHERHNRLEADAVRTLEAGEEARDALHRDLADPIEALTLPSEPARWRGRLEAARAAADHARTLLSSAELAVNRTLRGRLAALDEGLLADEGDFRQAERLERIRHAPYEYDSSQGRYVRPRALAPYMAEFARAGIDVERGEPENMARRVRASRIRWYWVAALDEDAGQLPDPASRARLLAIARYADPHPWRDRFRDPAVWADKARLEALAAEPEAVGQPPVLVGLLARRIDELGGNPVPLMRAVLLRHPQDFWLHVRLGSLCKNLPEQTACYRAALAIRPRDAAVHNVLGVLYQYAGDDEQAIACYRRAIQLDPSYVYAHNNLAECLAKRGRRDESIRAYRNVLAIDARNVEALGNLGSLLRDSGRLGEATDCFRTVVANHPDLANGHHLLGHVLLAQGQFSEARPALRRAIELYTPDNSDRAGAQHQLAECEQMLSVESRLPTMLATNARPTNAGEALALARLCLTYREQPTAAARFYEAAFAMTPGPAEPSQAGLRFTAAAAVARATSIGDSRGTLSDEQRANFHRLALSWLRTGFDLCTSPEADTPARRAFARTELDRCLSGEGFASLREESGLARLPEGERSDWRQLWTEAASLRLDVEAREKTPFVLLGARGKPDRRRETLATALADAADGDVIEIRGDGPFDQSPISVRGKAIKVAAGRGARPLLRFRGADAKSGSDRKGVADLWKVTAAGITLEGLDLRLVGDPAGDGFPALLGVEGGAVRVAGCRFRHEGARPQPLAISTLGGTSLVVVGCEFLGPFNGAIAQLGQAMTRLRVEGCLFAGPGVGLVLMTRSPNDSGLDVNLRRNTFVGGHPIRVDLRAHDGRATAGSSATSPGKGVCVTATGNVMAGEAAILVDFLDARAGTVPSAAEGAAHLLRVFRWREEANIYIEKTPLLRVAYGRTNDPYWGWFTSPIGTETVAGDLTTWERYWKLKDTRSRAVAIRYAGHFELASHQALHHIGPAAYLLHPETLRGLDEHTKQQVGIPADLVGPGDAYERWKSTPAYLEWLRATVVSGAECRGFY